MKKKKVEEVKGKATRKKDSMVWIIAAVIIIALVVLFFVFTNLDKGGDGADLIEEEIDSLDVGDNPDVGVEDFNSLEVSQEEVASN